MTQTVNTLLQKTDSRYGVVPRFQLDYRAFCSLHLLTQSPPGLKQTTSRFASRLATHFPEVAVRIDDIDFGILPLEVGVLKMSTAEAILICSWYTVAKHFNFVDDLYNRCGAELRHAIDVAFLANLFYGEVSSNFVKARSLLPKSLTIALEKIERHYEEMVF